MAEPSGAKLMIPKAPFAVYPGSPLGQPKALSGLRKSMKEEQTRAPFIQVQGGLGYGVNVERTR